METISTTEFTPDNADDSPTKPVTDINSLFFAAGDSSFVPGGSNEFRDKGAETAKETSISDLKEEPIIPVIPAAPAAPVGTVPPFETPLGVPPAPAVVNKPEEIVFAPGEVTADTGAADVSAAAEDTFDPYGNISAQELKNTPPLVFGDDVLAPKTEPVPSEKVSSIPVPEYELNEEKPRLKDEDKLGVDFPETDKQVEQKAPSDTVMEEVVPLEDTRVPSQDDIVLPFGSSVFVAEEEAPQAKSDDIPQMPLYESDNYNNPVNAVGSEQNVSQPFNNASVYGDYTGAETQGVEEVPPYQPYGAEAFSTSD